MPRGSTVKIMHDTAECRVAEYAGLFPDWRYAGEFAKACEKDGGSTRTDNSGSSGRVYCEKDGSPSWEYVEGYVDIRPIYSGPPLRRDHTVLYRAIARAE
jgi:hypothetical protein